MLYSAILVATGFLVCNFSSITSHLISDDVLGRVASNIGIKDLVQTAVCVFLLVSFTGASHSWYNVTYSYFYHAQYIHYLLCIAAT